MSGNRNIYMSFMCDWDKMKFLALKLILIVFGFSIVKVNCKIVDKVFKKIQSKEE